MSVDCIVLKWSLHICFYSWTANSVGNE